MGILSECYKTEHVRSKKYFCQRKCLLLADKTNAMQPFLPKKWWKGNLYQDLNETLGVAIYSEE